MDNQSPILDNSTLAHREDAHDLTDSEAHASTSEESDVDVDHDPAIESRPRRRSRHHESRRRRHSRSSSSHDDDASNRPKPKLSKVDEDNSLPSKEQKTNAVSLPVVEDPLAVAKEFLVRACIRRYFIVDRVPENLAAMLGIISNTWINFGYLEIFRCPNYPVNGFSPLAAVVGRESHLGAHRPVASTHCIVARGS